MKFPKQTSVKAGFDIWRFEFLQEQNPSVYQRNPHRCTYIESLSRIKDLRRDVSIIVELLLPSFEASIIFRCNWVVPKNILSIKTLSFQASITNLGLSKPVKHYIADVPNRVAARPKKGWKTLLHSNCRFFLRVSCYILQGHMFRALNVV